MTMPAAAPAAPAPTPGSQTSEFDLTKYVTVAGTVLTVLGSLLATVESVLPAGSKASVYVGMGLAAIGALMKVAAVLGYQSSRADVKVAAAQAAGATAAAQAQASAGQNAATAAQGLG